jgi:hypothetical protein
MARTRLRGIELAGSRIAIEVPSHLDWMWPDERYSAFTGSPEGAAVHVGVRVGEPAEVPPAGFVYESSTHRFEVAERGDGWVVAIHSCQGLERVAVFDDDFKQGEVTILPDAAARGVAPLAHPLDELIALHRVARKGGLIVRGSAVIRDDRALVFLGSSTPPSGSGGGSRDTEATGWRRAGSQQLRGDRIVLIPEVDGVRVLGSPWHSDEALSRPFNARLDALHVIQPARAVFADRLDLDDSISELLVHAFAPIHDDRCAERLFDAAADAVSHVPVLRLGLPEEKRVVPFTWGTSEASLAFAPPFVS